MTIEQVRETGPHQILYRDSETGIAWIADGSTGLRYTVHPSIDASGSVQGMKSLGRWAHDARTVACDGFIYNIDELIVFDDNDRIVAAECHCNGRH
ncbi:MULTISPECIES: hypothetical protein [Mycolicibacter]|uniref:Uncharacterized protein n=2 Tax=Mycolicibacter TaxID=1073531 RepID=A0ABU5XMB1_9MYCO|nr:MULTISPECIES: hypothetical protein [unclassified Mycolicibacter]MEB3023341.1 hypothetical protein [Mycolicibacter sp. MYC098]MEB3035123.1 hypothetical protein [Mycolicibacter sp. MYC340]